MILCWLGFCPGSVVTAWDDTGALWVAWQCSKCGAIKNDHRAEREARPKTKESQHV